MAGMIPPPSTRPILAFVRDFTTAHGYPPTLCELAAGTGLSQGIVLRRLQWAERDGELTHKPRCPRSWTLTAAGERKVGRG